MAEYIGVDAKTCFLLSKTIARNVRQAKTNPAIKWIIKFLYRFFTSSSQTLPFLLNQR